MTAFFQALRYLLRQRLGMSAATYIDATNLTAEERHRI